MIPRPWLSTYPPTLPHSIEPAFGSMLDVFTATVARRAESTAICYFDGALSFRELDLRSSALAVALLEGGFRGRDRLAIYTQNNPAFLVGLLAAWKADGVAVPINPMNPARELSYLLEDSGATALLCLDTLYASVVHDVITCGHTSVRQVVLTSARDDQTRNDPRVLPADPASEVPGARRLSDLMLEYRHAEPPVVVAGSACAAVITYTSGTTGVPKGTINTHGGLTFNSQTYQEWVKLGGDDVILGIAPLFHITGLVGHACLSLLLGAELVLLHRFEGAVVLDAIRERRPTFTVGAITAFVNLAGQPTAGKDDFRSLRVVYSGGAPISPRIRDDIRSRTGMEIHNIYGMTETTSPTHAVPLGVPAPVDAASGALSIGVPVFNTVARVIGDDGTTLPPGQLGELAISGPQVTPGYWHKPEQTAEKIVAGELRTGDMGLMDDAGWFYLVDRKSDMIIASGYKVWPREVEDVLLSHPAVHEAAVVGVQDPYRGETVKAVVSLQPDSATTPDALVTFCRSRLAAYKRPRIIDILEELPKSAAGKILRRELR